MNDETGQKEVKKVENLEESKNDAITVKKLDDDKPKVEERQIALIENKQKTDQLKPPTLQNVVATADLHTRLDLRKIA